MTTKVAVVTGSNKGIGYAIVRGLCKRFDGVVYLTSRDVDRGKKAVEELNKEGLSPAYHQLDIIDKKSLETFRDYIKSKYEGIDILVNNAAIAFKQAATEPVSVQAKETLFVNYFSLVSTCDVLFPLLKNGARVVNVSSSAARLNLIPSTGLREKLKDVKLTVAELSELMQQYVDAAQQGTHAAEWGNSSYVVSKVGVTALSNIQQRMLNSRDGAGIVCVTPSQELSYPLNRVVFPFEPQEGGLRAIHGEPAKGMLQYEALGVHKKDIKVNSVHPGFVDTDMTSHKGPLTIDEGAVAPLFLALDADDSVRGKYVWYNKKIVDWDGERPEEN